MILKILINFVHFVVKFNWYYSFIVKLSRGAQGAFEQKSLKSFSNVGYIQKCNCLSQIHPYQKVRKTA